MPWNKFSMHILKYFYSTYPLNVDFKGAAPFYIWGSLNLPWTTHFLQLSIHSQHIDHEFSNVCSCKRLVSRLALMCSKCSRARTRIKCAKENIFKKNVSQSWIHNPNNPNNPNKVTPPSRIITTNTSWTVKWSPLSGHPLHRSTHN